MTSKQIMDELKSGKYRPIYFLMGEEPYYIDIITKYISEHALPPEHHAFNQLIMYGKDVTAAQIDDTARRFPMMSERLVVIVKEAQNIKKIENLVHYVQKPLNSTILVINYKYKSIDKRKKLYKALKKNSVIFESKKLYENQIPLWISNYLEEKEFTINPLASRLLVENLGTDLEKIANELNKLIIVLKKGSKINPIHIEENIGISKDYNVFELQNALMNRDILKANKIVKYFANNPKGTPFIMTINSLYYFFSKILIVHSLKDKSQQSIASALKVHPFFAKNYLKGAQTFSLNKLVYIVSILRQYDMMSKGVNNNSMTDGELLKEMIFKIMH